MGKLLLKWYFGIEVIVVIRVFFDICSDDFIVENLLRIKESLYKNIEEKLYLYVIFI